MEIYFLKTNSLTDCKLQESRDFLEGERSVRVGGWRDENEQTRD